eukprot:3833060-Amphidinium_carterae.1
MSSKFAAKASSIRARPSPQAGRHRQTKNIVLDHLSLREARHVFLDLLPPQRGGAISSDAPNPVLEDALTMPALFTRLLCILFLRGRPRAPPRCPPTGRVEGQTVRV